MASVMGVGISMMPLFVAEIIVPVLLKRIKWERSRMLPEPSLNKLSWPPLKRTNRDKLTVAPADAPITTYERELRFVTKLERLGMARELPAPVASSVVGPPAAPV